MGSYYIDITCDFSMQDMTQALRDEESLFLAEFKDSRVMTADDLSIVNHAKFEECDSPPAKSVTVIKKGDGAPPGTAKLWSGTMVISSTITAVEVYR